MSDLPSEIQVIAVDWSGRQKRAGEATWLACVRDGRLVELENGRERAEVIAEVVRLAAAEPRTVAGLDFAFSFPSWFCELEGWTSGREVWQAMRDQGEGLLDACKPPFWGRPGTTAQTLGLALRETELTGGAKSVFQIGGAGAVGTGSVRGMPHLLTLADAGFAIWPFDAPRWPLALEIYPRLLTGKVDKSRHRARRDYLTARVLGQDPVLVERAAGSEDAFDAAVSALRIAETLRGLEQLPQAGNADPRRIEGAIWRPPS